uniref:Uncharacterized protein n=1 Tax=Spumella elongata TaxID=89044 RepID=A0A7S3GYQ9_9STRA
MKVKFVEVNKLKCLSIVCNARFVEIYAMKDSLLKYMTTMRGVAPEGDLPSSDFPLFECKYTDDNCEFRELHLKFLSIKPALVTDPARLLQLSLVSLLCEYSAGTADTAPPLQQGPSLGGLGGAGGMNMMAMMAMSMMGGMPGGMGGMRAKAGLGGVPQAPGMPGAVRTNPVQVAPPAVPATTAEGAQSSHSNSYSDSQEADVIQAVDAVSPAHSIDGTAGLSDSAHKQPEPKTAPARASAAPVAPNASTTAATGNPTSTSFATGSAQNKPAAAAPGLDIGQLASMLWTVKGSMLEEMGQLLDRKLAPVMSRLDRIDSKLKNLEVEVGGLKRRAGDTDGEQTES